MKKMTCKQLWGACDEEFMANSFEEIWENIKKHGIEMFKIGDNAHIEAMDKMKWMMKNPESMKEWMESKRNAFDSLADNK